MAVSIKNESFSESEPSSKCGSALDCLELLDMPDDGAGLLMLVGIVVVIVLIAMIRAAVEAWSKA